MAAHLNAETNKHTLGATVTIHMLGIYGLDCCCEIASINKVIDHLANCCICIDI